MSDELNTNETQGQEFDITSFNEGFGTQFEDVGSLKNTLNGYNELKGQLEGLNKTNEEWGSKYQDLEGKYNNVMSYFTGDDVIEKLYGSKDTWQRVQLEKKFADKDPNVVSTIYGSDLNNLSDADAILLADKLNVRANIPDSDRRQAIFETLLGEDVDLNELNPTQKYKLSKAAAEAKRDLAAIKEFQPEGPTFDWLQEAKDVQSSLAEKQTTLKDSWAKVAKETIPKYDGTSIFDGDGDDRKAVFSYKPDDDFKEKITSLAVEQFTKAGLEVNDNNIKLLNDWVNQQHVLANYEKMIKKAMADQKTITEDEEHNFIHNDKKKNEQEAPPVDRSKTMTLNEYRASKKR